MEIKYEAVFGDYKFSSPACEVAMQSSFGEIIERRFTKPLVIPEGWGVIAMRRIIRTPTWTVADQKAGKLPEVGCEVINTDHSISLYVLCKVIYVDGEVVIVYNGELSQTYSHKAFLVAFKPIESPEEKAARLREEWCSTASKLLKNLEYSSTLTSIYDALLSGDLPVPVKENK